jgi:hypothetical protein
MQIKKKKVPSAITGQKLGGDVPSSNSAAGNLGITAMKMKSLKKGVSEAQMESEEKPKLEAEVSLGPTRAKYIERMKKKGK